MRSGTEEAGGLCQRREIVNDRTVLAKVCSKSLGGVLAFTVYAFISMHIFVYNMCFVFRSFVSK